MQRVGAVIRVEGVRTATVEVAGEPLSKARARTVVHGGRATTFTPARTRDAERDIGILFVAQNPRWRPAVGRVAVRITFEVESRRRRDIDNMAKLVLDALNGLAWVDDHQIDLLSVERERVAKGQARTFVHVAEIGGP